jgi:hypothetical protein
MQHRKAIAPETNVFFICFKSDDDTAAVLKVDLTLKRLTNTLQYHEEVAEHINAQTRVLFVQCGVDRTAPLTVDLEALQQSGARVLACSARTGEGQILRYI